MSTLTPLPRSTGWFALTVSEAKLLWRDPGGLIIPVALPLLIMVMNGMGAKGFSPPGGVRTFDTVATPVALGMIIATTALVNVPAVLVSYRKTGVLRRMSATPVSPLVLLGAQVLVNLALSALGITLALTVATLAFDLSAPASPLVTVIAVLLGVFANYALGVLLAALAPSANAAIGIGLGVFFATFAAGGGFLPAERLPRWLAAIGEFTPFGAMLQAVRDGWSGAGPAAPHLVVLAALGVLLTAISVRVFRWE
ncbi:ABC transporter permease [Crossiella sp. CA198]|uniref:ABC transporter permease n=1 Tax=Crossiella sp. CA198 TaxID=3455607 RepID=UPI003F8D38A0